MANSTCTRKTGSALTRVLICLLPFQLAQAQTLIEFDGLSATATDIKAIAEQAPQPAGRATYGQPANVRGQAEDVLLRRWLAKQAGTAGLEQDPILAARLKQAREYVLSEAWLEKVANDAVPDAAAVSKYASELYRGSPNRFRTHVEWQARHILISPANPENKQKAVDLLNQLKAGASFEKLAAEHSTDKVSAANGGDLGWFGPGKMVEPFQEAVAALTHPGALSDIVETRFGYHLIRLDGKKPAGTRPFDEVKADLEREVVAAIKRTAKEQVVARSISGPKVDMPAIEALARELGSK